MKVIWDEAKNHANQKKHGVSFEDASQLFLSGAAYLETYDELHSDHEERSVAIGPIAQGVVLVVFTERDEDRLRIISARWATKREMAIYRRYMQERNHEQH